MWLKFIVLLTIAGTCCSLCVLDNKKGWWLDCGIRDSYLLRVKDFGGVYVRFDFDVGMGDEGGFPYSIDNTNKDHPPPKGIPPYIIPQVDKQKLYQRSSNGKVNMKPPSRYGDKRSRERTLNVRESSKKRRNTRHKSKQRHPMRSKNPPTKYMKFHSSEKNPPPEVFQSPDKKGIWIRVPAESADHIDINHVISPPQTPNTNIRDALPKSSYKDSKYRTKPPRTNPHGSQSNYRYDLRKLENKQSIEHHYEESFDRENFYNSDQHLQYPGPTQFEHGFKPFRSPPPLPSTTPAPYSGPVIGRVLGEILKLPATTPADTDHVPSFAAQLMVVKDAPISMHPPEYNNTNKEYSLISKLPRTKFFCEEQEYLPGLYADIQLGCKIFHLCTPAPLGSTIQSFLCPNSTLFDQSILQCNYWQLVDCSSSANHYEANQPMAHSYRRINAAHLPASDVKDPFTLSLLSDIAY